MKRIALALSTVAVLASAALAGPIEDRQAFMKENGRLLGALSPMVKGEQPFDAADALAKLEAFSAHAQTLDVATLFPEGSGEGDTAASPKIWEDFAGFQATAQKLKDEAAAGVSAAPQDIEALKASFGAIGTVCGTCHETYRLKKD